MNIECTTIKPPTELHDFVESFWMLNNHSNKEHQIVVLPDGRFDIIFSLTNNEKFKVVLKGLETEPIQTKISENTVFFVVSFKLLSIEYLLNEKVHLLINEGYVLLPDFWDITASDLNDFEAFCSKISEKLISLIKPNIDKRKQQLFDFIYSSDGMLSVKELSEKVFWSNRQINRYFTQTFGISLKAYCNILRFRASFQDIKNGDLFPQGDFFDQPHFIREIKKFSGALPKELKQNKNDRFIQFSTLPKK